MRLFLIVFYLFIISQNKLKAQNNDCNSAVILTQADTLYSHKEKPLGYGKIKELNQLKKYDSTYFKNEKNSSWYILNSPYKAELTFTIIPDNINDDYDFMFFDASVEGFCDSIKTARIKPLRSNISRNDKAIKSVTGLNKNADTAFVGMGVGSSFSKDVVIEAGKNYMLVLANDKTPLAGYVLKINYKEIKSNSVAVDSLLAKMEAEAQKNKNRLQLVFADAETKEKIETDIVVRTASVDTGFVISGNNSYKFPLNSSTDLMAVSGGFMIEKRTYQILPDSSGYVDTVYLRKIVPDSYLDIIPFYFEGNTDKLLPKSKPALTTLLLFLQKNSHVKIEIQGHANGPKQKNLKEFKRLSEKRADAIKKYLLYQGINKKRCHVEGFGNSMMLFPDPKNDEESELNRRVEIKIVKVD